MSNSIVTKPDSLRALHHFCTNVGMTGVETFVLQLCAAQRQLGITPALSLDTTDREEVVEAAELEGATVYVFPPDSSSTGSLRGKFRTARVRSRRVAAVVRALRAHKADILHLHAVGVAGFDALVAAAITRTPTVITHHATLGWFGAIRRPVDRATFGLERMLGRRIVMPYAAAAEELVARGASSDRVRVVPFCIDEQRFTAQEGRAAPRTPFRLAILSRLVKGKGHADLLQAVRVLGDRCPSLRLDFIGDGPLRGDLERLAGDLGLSERVTLHGWVKHSLIPRLLSECDALALPSQMPAETFPVSLMEGMGLGLPCIGSRWFGIPDVIGPDGAGEIVEPGDVRALAEAIAKLATDVSVYRRASAAALARARRRFTGRVVAEAYRQLYHESMRPLSEGA